MENNKIRFALGVLFIFIFTACSKGTAGNIPPENEDGNKKVCSAEAIDYKLAEMDSQNSFDDDFQALVGTQYVTPTEKISPSQWPALIDDLDLSEMEIAIERQLKRYEQKDLSGTIKFGNDVYSLKQAPKSLKRFMEIAKDYKSCMATNTKSSCQADFEATVKADFNLYMPKLSKEDPRFGEDKQTLFTAYYTPLIRARTSKDSRFKYGTYNKPSSKSLASSSRRDIDFKGVLENKGLDIFYSDDLFELYLLHVQGGGRVITENKNGKTSSFYISYDGANGQKFTFISKYMMSKGYIPDLTIQSQRDFIDQNPQKHEEIFSTCPSYVYFKKTANPPLGNDVVPLTDNRSIATDTAYYRFKGLISFVSARRPKEDMKSCDGNNVEYQSFSRFFLDQDTGGAIKGKARVDMYFGEGPYAEHVAYNTVQRGDLYFLMLKN